MNFLIWNQLKYLISRFISLATQLGATLTIHTINPLPIRKIIYTTNAMEGLHRQIRKATKTKGAFTSDMALLKLVLSNNKKY